MVYIKNYIFDHFYQQYLVLLTMVPRDNDHNGVFFHVFKCRRALWSRSNEKTSARYRFPQKERHGMLCYAMLCYAMLFYAMLRYAMLCYATVPM